MPKEKIVLPRPAIVSLYRNSLYRKIGSNLGPALRPETESIPYLGNNSKRILLIVRFATDTFLPERHLTFVAKILSACNMNIGDVALVNDKSGNFGIDVLYEQFRPVQTVVFGIDPGELGFPNDVPMFSITTFRNSRMFHTPSLDALNVDTPEATAAKKKLWGCLKQAFSV